MRIIGGDLAGRQFQAPKGHQTHPMSDKMRGAIFNALGDISGLTVLDAFSGSGALAIEAVSRGASGADAVDSDNNAVHVIRKNVAALDLKTRIKIVQAKISSWLKTNESAEYDLILCDPPYDNLQQDVISQLATLLRTDRIFVLSWPGSQPLPVIDSARLVSQKEYNDSQLAFYRKNSVK
jgi:16S rRNA (guanine966-N2)-methyltransferase